MIKINLLPHREARRKQKKAAFIALMTLSGIIGVIIVMMVGGYNARQISIQEQRNAIIRDANRDLDKKIAEIATLKQEIEALKARQQAVEDLQGDRNQPVYLLDELVKQTPQGVHLRSFKQDGQRVLMSGLAQSQERVAELLRNLASNSPWLEKPDLTEVRAVQLAGSKTGRKVVEFTLAVAIKRPRDKDAAEKDGKGADGKPAAPGAVNAAAPGLAATNQAGKPTP
jgi:type IV pilus assembly protein PilN